jgi:hypothetical protein
VKGSPNSPASSLWPECGQEKDIRFMVAKAERREVLLIPKARERRESELGALGLRALTRAKLHKRN